MNIVFKRTRRADLDKCANVVKLSFNALRRRSGMATERFPRGHPFSFEHFLKTDPQYSYCAWHGSRVVGFTQAINRGKQWHLAFLFIHPKYQDQKIGKELVSRVWRDEPGVTHALSTFAYNNQAIGIYGRFGMAPIASIVRLQVPQVELRLPPEPNLQVRIEFGRADLKFIDDLEGKIRGYTRSVDWEQFFSHKKYRRFIFLKDGRRVGYSAVGVAGGIGPVGAVSSKILKQVTVATLYEARRMKPKVVGINFPTENIELYQILLKCGFRVQEMALFLSDAHYGDLQRYIPAPLAMF
jgi:GNAT superfamily N-acetyltransferase